MCILYFYISDILLYKNTAPNPAYPGEFLHINNKRAHNNYENIILKEANENPQRAHLGPRAPLWTKLQYRVLVMNMLRQQYPAAYGIILMFTLLKVLDSDHGVRCGWGEGGGRVAASQVWEKFFNTIRLSQILGGFVVKILTL